MYKVELQATKNIYEYESLVLGLMVTKDMNIQELEAFGDSQLIVQQVKNIYRDK